MARFTSENILRIRTFSLSNASLTGFADRVGGGKGAEEGASAIVCRAKQLDD